MNVVARRYQTEVRRQLKIQLRRWKAGKNYTGEADSQEQTVHLESSSENHTNSMDPPSKKTKTMKVTHFLSNYNQSMPAINEQWNISKSDLVIGNIADCNENSINFYKLEAEFQSRCFKLKTKQGKVNYSFNTFLCQFSFEL